MRIEIDIAQRFREERGYQGKGGVVILYFDVPTAWCEVLPDPRGWSPGCIAVGEEGRTWVASGGNENDGAREWQPFGNLSLDAEEAGLSRRTTAMRSSSFYNYSGEAMFGFFKAVAKNKKARGAAAKHVQKGGTGPLAKVFAGAGHNAQQKKKQGK